MKKYIIIAIVVLVLVVGVGFGWYWGQRSKNVNNQNRGPVNLPQATEDHPLVKDDFSILLLKGWREIPPVVQGVTLSVVDEEGDYSAPDVKRINFRSNYNVSYDQLKSRDIGQYTEYIKSVVKQMTPDVVFSNEGTLAIHGREAHIFEGEISQQGLDFHVMVVLIPGDNGDVWNISFNSLKSDWVRNAPLFARVANSFQVK